jgi:hypothetical protein
VRRQGRQRDSVLIETGGQPDGIGEIEAEHYSGFRQRPKGTERVKRKRQTSGEAESAEGKMMRRLRTKRKENWPDTTIVEIGRLHLPMQNCPKSESRISSTFSTPVISPTARSAARRSTAIYSGARPACIVA